MLPTLPSGSTFRLRYAMCPAPAACNALDVQLLPGAQGDSLDCEHDALLAIKAAARCRCSARFFIETTATDRFSVAYIWHFRLWCRDLRPDAITARRILHRAVASTSDVGLQSLLLADESGRWRRMVRTLADAASRSLAAPNHPIDNIEAVLARVVLQQATEAMVRSEVRSEL